MGERRCDAAAASSAGETSSLAASRTRESGEGADDRDEEGDDADGDAGVGQPDPRLTRGPDLAAGDEAEPDGDRPEDQPEARQPGEGEQDRRHGVAVALEQPSAEPLVGHDPSLSLPSAVR